MDLPANKYHELDCYYTWMGEDGIARTKVKKGAEIKLDDAKANSVVVNQLAEGSYSIIVDTTEITSITKEARDFFSIQNRKSKINGIAIIQNSILGNMVANFFIGINRPTVPVKLFKKEAEAIEWCKKISAEVHAN